MKIEVFHFIHGAQVTWSDTAFERWIFQQDAHPVGARQRFDSQLAFHLERIDRICQLTEAQKKKLQLAGRGDIKRFFDGFERVKQRFKALNNDAQKLHEVQEDATPLQTTLQAGLFHDDSLLLKSLRTTLTAEQLERYVATIRERRSFRHRAGAEKAVAMLELNMPLRDAQRRDLIALMLNETKLSDESDQDDSALLLSQLGQLPEEKLKPLFSEKEWQVAKRQLDQMRGLWQRVRIRRIDGMMIKDEWAVMPDVGGIVVPAPAK